MKNQHSKNIITQLSHFQLFFAAVVSLGVAGAGAIASGAGTFIAAVATAVGATLGTLALLNDGD